MYDEKTTGMLKLDDDHAEYNEKPWRRTHHEDKGALISKQQRKTRIHITQATVLQIQNKGDGETETKTRVTGKGIHRADETHTTQNEMTRNYKNDELRCARTS